MPGITNTELSADLETLLVNLKTQLPPIGYTYLAALEEAARRIALHDPVDLVAALLNEAPESQLTSMLLVDREWLARTLTSPQVFFDLVEAWKETTMGRVPDVEVLSFALKWVAAEIAQDRSHGIPAKDLLRTEDGDKS